MILYFDNYITDQPFYAGTYKELGKVRSSSKIYNMPSKLDITLYSLASYAEIDWSSVIIKYELENIKQKQKFEKEVKKLFPNAIIIYGRSDSQKKFQESIKIMEKLKDDWIFYAGNNDHPFISPDKQTLGACLKKAKEIKKQRKWVSIIISHFTEFFNKPIPGTPFHELEEEKIKKISEDEDCMVCLYPKGLMHSVQIIHIDLFKYWFNSGDSKGALVRRSECMEPFIKKIKNQYVITPKRPLCAHFDGEMTQEYSSNNIPHDSVPPLFIPQGFFESKIKIRFGYEDYKEDWVNINPMKKNYSFRDKNGTDLKIGLEEIPLFWKKRISKIDINKNLIKKEIDEAIIKNKELIYKPFLYKNKYLYRAYRSRALMERRLYKSKLFRKITFSLFSKFPSLKKFYKKSITVNHKNE
jgi:hypothetical protein